MFNLQGSEIIIVLLLALVVLGPEKLPDAMRKAGRFVAELRKMSSGFQEEFRKAAEPFSEATGQVRETANLLRDSADFTKLTDGQRPEKAHSAEMAPAMPDVTLVTPAEPAALPATTTTSTEPTPPADPHP